LLDHIRENAKSKNIFIDTINCTEDHIHVLVSLGIDQTISKIVRLIKSESSYWINKHKLSNHKFEWQDDYFAVSVSESGIDTVRKYIAHQEEHHKKKSFGDEYREFLIKYNFEFSRSDFD
ncbi:MAG: transposase, partial [Ignavibacteria bacterium RBG_13_36_8]